VFRGVYSGDPRGYCVKLYMRDATAADIDSGRARAIYVPAPNY